MAIAQAPAYYVVTEEQKLQTLVNMLNARKPFAQVAEQVDKFTMPELQKLLGDQKFRRAMQGYLADEKIKNSNELKNSVTLLKNAQDVKEAVDGEEKIVRKASEPGKVAQYLDDHIPLKMAVVLYATDSTFKDAWNEYFAKTTDINQREERMQAVLHEQYFDDWGRYLVDTGKALFTWETWKTIGNRLYDWNEKTPWYHILWQTPWELGTNYIFPIQSALHLVAGSEGYRQSLREPTPANFLGAAEQFKGHLSDVLLTVALVGKVAKTTGRAARKGAAVETFESQVDRTVAEMNGELAKRGLKGEDLKRAGRGMQEAGERVKAGFYGLIEDAPARKRITMAATAEAWSHMTTAERYQRMLRMAGKEVAELDEAAQARFFDAYQQGLLAELSPKQAERIVTETAEATKAAGKKAADELGAMRNEVGELLDNITAKEKEIAEKMKTGEATGQLRAEVMDMNGKVASLQKRMEEAGRAATDVSYPTLTRTVGRLAKAAMEEVGELPAQAAAAARKNRKLLERSYGAMEVRQYIDLWKKRRQLARQAFDPNLDEATRRQILFQHMTVSSDMSTALLAMGVTTGLVRDGARLARWYGTLPFSVAHRIMAASPAMQVVMHPLYAYYLRRAAGYGTQQLTEIRPDVVPALKFKFESPEDLRKKTMGSVPTPQQAVTGEQMRWMTHVVYQGGGRTAQGWFTENVAEGKEREALEQLLEEGKGLGELMLMDEVRTTYASRGLLKPTAVRLDAGMIEAQPDVGVQEADAGVPKEEEKKPRRKRSREEEPPTF